MSRDGASAYVGSGSKSSGGLTATPGVPLVLKRPSKKLLSAVGLRPSSTTVIELSMWTVTLISLANHNFVYIRNEGDGAEQLFDGRADPQELSDRSRDDSVQAVLEDFRRQFQRFREKLAQSAR